MKNEEVRARLYKGHEIIWHEWQMRGKMILHTAAYCLLIHAAVFAALAMVYIGYDSLSVVGKWWFAKVATLFTLNPKLEILGHSVYARQLLSSSLANIVAVQQQKMFLLFVVTSATWLFTLPKLIRHYTDRSKKAIELEHVRGMKMISSDELKDALEEETGLLPFGPVTLPAKYEPEHIFIGGKTRVGKSVTIMQQVDAVRQANGRMVIYDFKGEYVEKFFDPEIDHIMNPLDDRGTTWNLFNDISHKADLNAITGSLIPPATGDNQYFNMAAADVLRGLLAALFEQNRKSMKDLWAACTLPVSEMAELCNSTPSGAAGYTHIQDASSKQAISVVGTMMSYVSWLEFASLPSDSDDFGIGTWLDQSAETGGIIFLTGRPETESTLRPFVSLFVDLMGKKFLSLPDGQSRLYFFLDEFGNMQKLPTVKRLLTAGGSKGATMIIGIQDFAAIENIYGREDAQTIYNSCGTNLILNVADPGTAKTFSDRFGEYQYWDTSETTSMGPQDNRDGLSLVRQKHTERLILPSEIQSLPKLEGFLKMPEFSPARVKIPIREANNKKSINPAFVLRPGFSLVDLEERDEKVAAAQSGDSEEIVSFLLTDADNQESSQPENSAIGQCDPSPSAALLAQIKSNSWVKDQELSVVRSVLDVLKAEGDCSSMVGYSAQEPEGRAHKKEVYDALGKITLLGHSVRVARLMKAPANSKAGTAYIAALAHDLGKIPRFYDHYSKIGNHALVSVMALAQIPGYQDLGDDQRTEIDDIIRQHHDLKPVHPMAESLKQADELARTQVLAAVLPPPKANPEPNTEDDQDPFC